MATEPFSAVIVTVRLLFPAIKPVRPETATVAAASWAVATTATAVVNAARFTVTPALTC